MTPSKFLLLPSSFESIRKQAKKLARQVSAGDPSALARVRAHLPVPTIPLSLRDAQLVLAREYGFPGWLDLRAAALRRGGKGLEWAASEAQRAIHNNKVDRLTELVQEYPALLSWRDDSGKSLLQFATASFGDSGDPYREQVFTRVECAGFLLAAGASVEPSIWEGAMKARATGVLQLLSRLGVLPRTLDILAALGDEDAVRDGLLSARVHTAHQVQKHGDDDTVTQAFLCACRFQQRPVAALLLNRCIELDPALGEKVEKWRGRSGLIDYLAEHPQAHGSPWHTVVMNQLQAAMSTNDVEEFGRWLQDEEKPLSESDVVTLLENAAYSDRPRFITLLIEFNPALKGNRPQSSALEYALEYGNAHLIPLLTQIWPLPDDLPHAAGIGDFPRVRSWFDGAGHLQLGSLDRHHPINHPSWLRNLHWAPPNAQHILDVAFAWACMNGHFDVADFLLQQGADINTNWSTHEPASILHECAIRANYQAAQFLVDRGIDMTTRDYRWNATAEGWARHAAKDLRMAEFLASAERSRAASSTSGESNRGLMR